MLHPQARAALEAAAGDQRVSDPAFDVEAERARDRAAALAGPREQVAQVRDLEAAGVPVRFYRPAVDRVPALVVHLHGGGFVLNDVEVHDASARRLANRTGMAVLSVEYRRPPEHPFPAAPDDVSAVTDWLVAGGLEELGLDPSTPLLAHGDSAGANLALVAALRHPGRFAALALIYPFLDPTMAGESYRTEVQGFDPADARWYWDQYAATPADLEHPDLAPLRSDRLGTLPPTLVVTAEHDPLRDEGELLAGRLAELGVEVVGTRYLGMLHGFWRHPDAYHAAEPLMRQVAAFLGQHV
ncbi:alpha/beta hydrolase [Nocardioides campestrisoli]|uniref:alpha/beta hydrolase n=1 Tax=Nocardioides campestrisoli TaxID=2736757 RepID=UPI0015E6CC8D|nr:alpha/beta hydrolase [Nocardioides campestrisoli]